MMKPQTRHAPLRASLTLAAAAMLAACGGGGGGGGGDAAAPPVTIDPAQFKGRWLTPGGVTPAMTAVVLPDASGKANAWLLAHDASRVVKLVLFSDSSANGVSYALTQNTDGQSVLGKVAGTLTSSPKRMSLTDVGVGSAALAFDQSDAMATAAVQADIAGTWESQADDKARTMRWTLTSAGTISGSATTGCSFAGNLSAMSSSNAYSAQFDESCPDGVTTRFSGIATMDQPKERLTVTAVTADAKRAVAILFSAKQ